MQNELLKILKKASEILPARLKLIGIDVKPEDILPSTINTNNNNINSVESFVDDDNAA